MKTPTAESYWVVDGEVLAGKYPGAQADAEARAKIADLLAGGVRTFVDLTEDGELLPYAHLLPADATHHRIAVRDVTCPRREQVREALDLIDAGRSRGVVYVHCRGGCGRTGVVIGAYLVRHAEPPGRALERVRELTRALWTKPCPETREQIAMIESWSEDDTSELRDRVRGCLLGGALGDALGAPVQFLTLGEIRRRYDENGIREFDSAYGRRGAITDDTQMTLFTAEGLLRAHNRYVGKGIASVPTCVWHAYLLASHPGRDERCGRDLPERRGGVAGRLARYPRCAAPSPRAREYVPLGIARAGAGIARPAAERQQGLRRGHARGACRSHGIGRAVPGRGRDRRPHARPPVRVPHRRLPRRADRGARRP